MRLIDADALVGRWKAAMLHMGVDNGGRHPVSMEVAIEDVEKRPTIDAVPVVRCGECERRNKSADLTDTVYCPWLKLQMRKTDFCSYGERKDGAEDG